MSEFDVGAFTREMESMGIMLTAIRLADGRLSHQSLADDQRHESRTG
jgi:hypothetical protein